MTPLKNEGEIIMKCLIIDVKIDRNWHKYKYMGWEHIQRRGAEGIGLCHHSYAPHPRDKNQFNSLGADIKTYIGQHQ